MKKIAIPYSVTAFATGVIFVALGFYLLSSFGSLTESFKDSEGAVLIYLIFFIPIIMLYLLVFGSIIIGIFYISYAGFALKRTLQSNLQALKRNAHTAIVCNALILPCILVYDWTIFRSMSINDGIEAAYAVFAVLLTVLSVALEVLSVLTDKKAKKKIIEQQRSR